MFSNFANPWIEYTRGTLRRKWKWKQRKREGTDWKAGDPQKRRREKSRRSVERWDRDKRPIWHWGHTVGESFLCCQTLEFRGEEGIDSLCVRLRYRIGFFDSSWVFFFQTTIPASKVLFCNLQRDDFAFCTLGPTIWALGRGLALL